jgi:bacteriorhodopsin
MKKVISGEAVESAGSAYLAFAVGAVVCGWPWLLAWRSLHAPKKASGATAFLVVSVVIAALFVVPVSSAPAEGVGMYVVLCIALVWAAYPLCKIIGRLA